MTLVRKGAFTALALVSVLAAQQANAQGLRGFRVEAQTGYDQFSADGDHHGKWGFGGAAGVDFDLGGFVLGPEVTYWWAPNEVKTIDGPGLAEQMGRERCCDDATAFEFIPRYGTYLDCIASGLRR